MRETMLLAKKLGVQKITELEVGKYLQVLPKE